MLVVALETEVAAYLEAHRDERDGDGREPYGFVGSCRAARQNTA